ncbi:MAG: efflux RND transporter permease subunit [Bythopirellula sp.]
MIAQFLYKNPRILLLLLCVIVVAGLSAYWMLPRLEDPVLGRRVAVVSTVFPGADSRRVESLVTIPIEQQLQGVADIKEIRSNSRTGISNIIIKLKDAVDDVDPVWSLIRTELSNIEAELPAGSLRPTFEVFPLKAFAAVIAVTAQDSQRSGVSVTRKLAQELGRQISNLAGTESVKLFGDPGEAYLAEIEPATLAALQLSTAAIAQQISADIATHPTGYVREGDGQLLLDLKFPDANVNFLGEVLVRDPMTGNQQRLADIASIDKVLAEPVDDIALVDGQPAVVLGAYFDDRIRVDRWSGQLQQLVDHFGQEYSADVNAEIIFSQHQYVTARLGGLLKNLLIGAAAVTLVVLLLMGWRSMIVVGVTLPLSSLMVLAGMRAMDIPMHQMSITGLIIALGLLIDNAIVVVEDVRGRIFAGKTTIEAIRQSIGHLAIPLFGSTLTTALAFMPIATLPGPPGEFVGTIALSVILAISASFVLAMTLVPALLASLRIDPTNRSLSSYGITWRPIQRLYESSLRVVYRFPLIGVLLGAILPACGFWAAGKLPAQFFPPSDRNQLQIEVELPARESSEKTRLLVEAIHQSVSSVEQVKRIHWFIGRSAPTFYYNVVPSRRGTPFYAQAIVDLGQAVDRTATVVAVQQQLDRQFPKCRSVVRQLEQGPPFDAPVEVRVVGPNRQRLKRLGSELRLILSQTPRVIHTRSDLEESIPKLVIDVNRREASLVQSSQTDVAQLLYTTLEGAPAGRLLDGDEELPVLVRMAGRAAGQLDRLTALRLISRPAAPPRQATGPPSTHAPSTHAPSTHAPTPLAAIAEFELGSDEAAVVRINGENVNEVKAYLEAGILPGLVLAEFKRRLLASDFRLPAGYRLDFGGEDAERADAVGRLIANAGLLFTLIILTLVVCFRSFRAAFIIVMVGALTTGLGPLALWLFGYPFGFMAIVGIMGLVGVAINDSIVVLAAIRENPRARSGDVGELTREVMGCTRHILATTVTTIAGFMPLILSGGGFWPPLAITIAGGVAGATFLALYFVPALHRLFHPAVR